MKRRNFLKNLGLAAGVPIAFQGIPLQLLSSHKPLKNLVHNSTNDNVLVILQMHGGNDSINSFIPIEAYDHYYSRRANIAIPYKSGNRTLIPLDSTLASADQVGLHPDMFDFKEMYDNGQAAVYQGVSYPKNNGSHFRGRDIWFMGGDFEDYYSSGWIGRYLAQTYAPQSYPDDFPNNDMPDPLALEMGNDSSLLFHQEGNIPTSISLGNSPAGLLNQIENLEGFGDEGIDPRGLPPEFLNGSAYKKEMDWILGLEDKSETYVRRLQQIYEASSDSSVEYPEVYPFNAPSGNLRNPLSGQLKLVSRLLGGGIKTKVFLVKIGGFDTHAQQVESYDSTMGTHSTKMYHISAALKAFQKDLKARGISDKVLTITMSEFGRRIPSNGSYGTDHGKGGAVMAFGDKVNAGVFGTNPDMSKSNIDLQFDYRQLYASILHDWFAVEKSVINQDIFFKDFFNATDDNGNTLPEVNMVSDKVTGNTAFIDSRYTVGQPYPNPASDKASITITTISSGKLQYELIDLTGKVMHRGTQNITQGENELIVDTTDLKTGMYHISIKANHINVSRKIIVK
ncbi:DUF1501 domain-containing protein [Marivirga atlantica]|jgi:uncharacterized protein (DUF1501 family)|uniref:DUF1501 domain-containing protein n=1 Tax=Marivirga atlantica TaxID=1548457 RepID=A0A937DDT3_9BACT|nr:DUF1501 domain-containing protein [Marivirga atlantica]MBL0764552.1 DUF1501 domain-containing protein [Marivirga atlantica]